MRLPARTYRRIVARMPILCVDGIVTNHRGQFLLVKRRNEPLQGRWWVPGGRVLKGERLVTAFRRKMREELGIPVEVLGPVGVYEGRFRTRGRNGGLGTHGVGIVFHARALSRDIRLDGQSSAWRYADRLPAAFRRFTPFARAQAR